MPSPADPPSAVPARLTLQLFGTPDLRDGEGRQLLAVLAGAKRVALLTYLVLAHADGFARRDTLIALFWPDATAEKARQALRSLLYVLRSELGDDAVVGRGVEEIGIAAGALDCDVLAFARAREAGDVEQMATLYRGDLLAGFFVDGAPDFERWLEDRRALNRRYATEALWAVAERRASEGMRGAAETYARAALALAPNDEHAVRRLMRLLVSLGDTGAALDVFDSFSGTLAQEYDARPAAESAALAQQIRSGAPAAASLDAVAPRVFVPREAPELQGISPVAAVASHIGPVASGERQAALRRSAPLTLYPRTAPDRQRHKGHARRWRVILAAAVVALAGFGIVMVPSPHADGLPSRQVNSANQSVAVMPFAVSGTPDLAFLGDGMVELIAQLLQGEGTLHALEPRLTLHAPVGRAGENDVDRARTLGAPLVLTGSVVGTASRLTVSAVLTDVATGAVRARAHSEGSRDGLTVIAERIVGRLLLDALPSAAHSIGHWAAPPPYESVRAFLAGREAYRRGDYEPARDAFERALAIDSGFVLPAFALTELSGYLPFDSHDAVALGVRLAARNAHMLGDADRALLAAIIGPDYPAPSGPLAMAAASERAAELNPRRPDAWYLLGEVYLHTGTFLGDSSFVRASRAFDRALAEDSLYAAPLEGAMEAAFALGDGGSGQRHADSYLRLHADAEAADYVRWRRALERGDNVALAAERERFPHYHRLALERVTAAVQTVRAPIVDAELAAHAMLASASNANDRVAALYAERDVALIAGKPTQAATFTRQIAVEARGDQARWNALLALVLDAELAGGDAKLADSVSALYHEQGSAPAHAADDGTRWPIRNLCILTQWDLSHHDVAAIRGDLSELRARAGTPTVPRVAPAVRLARIHLASLCGELGAIGLTLREGGNRAALGPRVVALAARSGGSPLLHGWVNVWIARLLEQVGEPHQALRLARQEVLFDGGHLTAGHQINLALTAMLAARQSECAAARRDMHMLLALQVSAESRIDARNKHLASAVAACRSRS